MKSLAGMSAGAEEALRPADTEVKKRILGQRAFKRCRDACATHMSVHMPVHMSAHNSAHMSTHMSANLSAHTSAHSPAPYLHTRLYTARHTYPHTRLYTLAALGRTMPSVAFSNSSCEPISSSHNYMSHNHMSHNYVAGPCRVWPRVTRPASPSRRAGPSCSGWCRQTESGPARYSAAQDSMQPDALRQKKMGCLWDDRELGTKILEPDLGNVHTCQYISSNIFKYLQTSTNICNDLQIFTNICKYPRV